MSPDRHGSGATRIEADLSIKRGRETDAQSIHLSCRPGLGAAGAAGVASAVPTVKFKAEAVPIPGFPHTGNILGAGTALKAEYDDRGHRIPRLAAAAHRRQLLPAQRLEAAPHRLPDLHEGHARTVRSDQVPQRLGGRSDRHGARLRDLRRRTRRRDRGTVLVLRAGRRLRVLHRRPLAGVAGNHRSTATTRTSPAAAASGPS